MTSSTLEYTRITATQILFIRDFLLPLIVLLILVYLPTHIATYVMIIGGQAHFLMAYLYQYRARKMNKRYLIVAGLLCIAALSYFAFSNAFLPLYIIASLVFAIHYVNDEVLLHGDHYSRLMLGTLAGFLLVFTASLFVAIIPNTLLVSYLCAGVFASFILFRCIATKDPITKTERYLWFTAALLFIFTISVPSSLLWGVTMLIIWLHYINWMISYGVRVAGTSRAKRYWKDTAWTASASLILGLIFIFTQTPLLGWFFGQSAFHAWAIAHIVLSSPLAIGFQKGYG